MPDDGQEWLWLRFRCSKCRYSWETPKIQGLDLDGQKCGLCGSPPGAVTELVLRVPDCHVAGKN